jgi:hypothetical protein
MLPPLVLRGFVSSLVAIALSKIELALSPMRDQYINQNPFNNALPIHQIHVLIYNRVLSLLAHLLHLSRLSAAHQVKVTPTPMWTCYPRIHQEAQTAHLIARVTTQATMKTTIMTTIMQCMLIDLPKSYWQSSPFCQCIFCQRTSRTYFSFVSSHN